MVHVETVNLVYAKLENRPGPLQEAALVLGQGRFNVDGVSLETIGSTAFLRVHVQRPSEAVDALRAAGVDAFQSEAILAAAHNRPGEIARLAGEMAAAGVNVEAIVTTANHQLIIRTSDNARAVDVLRKL